MSGLIEFGLYFTYILVGVAILAVIVLPLINALDNPKTLMVAGIGIGVLLVLFLISWAMSTYGGVSANAAEQGLTTAGVKKIGGVLTMMYILFFIAVIGIVATELGKYFK